MSHAPTAEAKPRPPLRLWPGVTIVVLQWLLRFALPAVEPTAIAVALLGGLAAGLLVILWWLFFSRAPWSERLAAVGLMAAALLVTPRLIHESLAGGMGGMLFFFYAVPVVSLALVLWAVASRGLAGGLRWASLAVAIVAACGGWALVRADGMSGEFDWDFSWRWSETAEERLVAQAEEPNPPPPAPAATAAPAEWPGFRGPGRDGVARGVRIASDWSSSPPVELWRRAVGPGWSSFAVGGGLLYTQEQREDEEVVAAYRAATGEPVWRHGDPARFWEPMGGAGPRATPTIFDGRVYTLGATGILNAFEAADGALVWSRDAAADTGAKVPGWGFAGSPLVIDDLVIVALAGRLAAYDRATGEPRWTGPDAGESYSSPHPVTIDGVRQVVLMSGGRVSGLAPADGALLWQESLEGGAIVQPAVTADGDLLCGTSGNVSGVATRRIALSRRGGGWTVEERWTSTGLKPYFNDLVVHEGHAYGFDGRILASIDLVDGERNWKGGRYGHGQLVLLPEQDLLLVLSERGELALVSATPDGFRELARLPAIEGKTWNHPVVAGDLLLVRNAQEMAAFRLPQLPI